MKVVALAGGVGGAKLANGLSKILHPDDFTVIVNTGDDFLHCGLYVSPDLDTVTYTLAGINNLATGWGRINETWNVHSERETSGFPAWFKLGDKDLALHLERTRLIQEGFSLTYITQHICQSFGISCNILPMTNSSVKTIVDTIEMGKLSFQEYFVKHNFQPRVKSIEFEGIESAALSEEIRIAVSSCDLVVICPSNPFVSIQPILSIPGMDQLLHSKPVVAISPIIGGNVVKGPAAKMFNEMGMISSSSNVARFYRGLISGFVLDKNDQSDKKEIDQWGIISLVTDTLMLNLESQIRLAKETIEFGNKFVEGIQV